MKKYELKELILRWQREELTSEQAIGQILLWLEELAEAISQLRTEPRKPKESR
ncbi:MAG TPA: hypothetical protein PKE64_08125 [Anaerolineae bacterium]|nr:hypothetical protein [Anaerolineae bacterium]HMR63960.1 hypothetical protein [Anaerolineae bacterium]